MNTTRNAHHTNAYCTYGNLALKQSDRPQLTLVPQDDNVSSAFERDARKPANPVIHPRQKGELARAVMALFLFCFILTGASLISDALIAKRCHKAVQGVDTVAVRVQQGDSLWNLAEQYGIEGMETSEVVRWIMDTNELSTATLYAGDTVLVASSQS